MNVAIKEYVGSRALTLEDGDRLHSVIIDPLKSGTPIRLDFDGVTDVSTAFLNTAVGQLYAELDSAQLRQLLIINNLNEGGQRSLEKVLTYARRFYQKESEEA